jgi:hypothetical protein
MENDENDTIMDNYDGLSIEIVRLVENNGKENVFNAMLEVEMTISFSDM